MLSKIPEGNMAIGHCRYAANSAQSADNVQPIVINHYKGCMAVCLNGRITNAKDLRDTFERNGAIFHTASDAEIIAYVITQARIHSTSIEDAVISAAKHLKGAYCLAVMSPTKIIIARDPYGIRPLCMGSIDDDIVFASESCALDAVGARFIRDVRPGEVITVNKQGLFSTNTSVASKGGLCVFEFIYFARPDSIIEGSSVHEARLRAGACLAVEHPVEADVVIGVPDSGIDAAIGYARQSGIPYGIGFVKNRYIGRTFIQPTQPQRDHAVRIKLNVINETVSGKRVVVIDDSIVRGTTTAHIVRLLRESGAAQVHMRLSSPPFIHPCHYGTDIDSADCLIAHHRSVDDILRIIGADSIGYLSVEALGNLVPNTHTGFCAGCFTGQYPEALPKHADASMI
jgi:amidophosphoribosyltransferase